MLNCTITETLYYDEERRVNITVYGFMFFPIGEKDKSVRTVNDLFCDKQEAITVMDQINMDGISEIHIDDIIEDMVIEIHEYVPSV